MSVPTESYTTTHGGQIGLFLNMATMPLAWPLNITIVQAGQCRIMNWRGYWILVWQFRGQPWRRRMTKKLRIDETPEGFVAYCHGASSPFSFLAGRREISASKIGDNYLFSTATSTGAYVLQLIWFDLDERIADGGSENDLVILANYCRSEMDHLEKALHMKPSRESLAAMELPTGRPFISWYSEHPGDPEGSRPEAGDGANRQSPGYLAATPYSACACMRNGRELVAFSVQGLGGGWTLESVRIKAVRIAFSTLFE